jgi:uncharacterized protein YndB with AHSA1/START domain
MSTTPTSWTEQQITVSIRAYGAQRVTVRGALGGGPDDTAYIAVTAGRALTYCYDLQAARSHAKGWAQAKTQPTSLLPRKIGPPASSATEAVAVCLQARDTQTIRVHLATPAESGEQRTHLDVGVGPLTIAVYDRTALASLVDGWAKALAYAQRIFAAAAEAGGFDELEGIERAQLADELAARHRRAARGR